MSIFSKWPTIDKAVDRFGYWGGFFAAVWTAVSWLFSQIGAVNQLGWSAVVLAGIGATCIVVFAVSAFLAAWRYFNSLRAPEQKTPSAAPSLVGDRATIAGVGTVSDPPPFNAARLYVGNMGADTDKLSQEQVLIIWAKFFNATGHDVFIHRATGAIKASYRVDDKTIELGSLPQPAIHHGSHLDDVKDGKEAMVVFDQRVSKELADKILAATSDARVFFDLKGLHFEVRSHNTKDSTRLPIWNGMTLHQWPDYIFVGRIIEAQAFGIIG